MNDDEKSIKTDGMEICTESFGNPKDPALLLIMGASASMVWWDDEFCRRLAGKGRFVIRYDNRDVGRSTCYEPGKPGYSVPDMIDDAIRVLDFYNIKKAHFCGMSLGGMIAQLVALRNPERVITLSLISSGPWDKRQDLPPISQKILDYHAGAASVNWTDENSAVKYMAEGWRLLNGSKHPFDEVRAYKIARTEFRRARNLLSMINHAFLKGGESYYGKINQISFPTLIIHGTEDPVLPLEHAKALEAAIPGSKLLALEGSGHEIHFMEWDNIINAIVNHTK